jgi:hypothetical protein
MVFLSRDLLYDMDDMNPLDRSKHPLDPGVVEEINSLPKDPRCPGEKKPNTKFLDNRNIALVSNSLTQKLPVGVPFLVIVVCFTLVDDTETMLPKTKWTASLDGWASVLGMTDAHTALIERFCSEPYFGGMIGAYLRENGKAYIRLTCIATETFLAYQSDD